MTDYGSVAPTGQRTATAPPTAGAGVRVIAVTGVLAIAGAVFQVATPGTPEASYQSLADYSRELGFLAYLLGSIASALIARRAGIATPASALLIAVGYGAVVAGVVFGLVLREDPEWFFLLGGPGNLLAGIGFVTLAVAGWRRNVFPAWASLLCAVGGLVAVLLSEYGTSILIGAFWLYLAATLHGRPQADWRRRPRASSAAEGREDPGSRV